MAEHEADFRFMRRALESARRGQGAVEPNPMVGTVIVQQGRIVGEGWHRQFGGPHAEVDALRAAGPASQGATAFVTLEPCCHHGKTPPCTDALIEAGIRQVIVAMSDPFPRVAGGGMEALRRAGIHVEVGLGHQEAHSLNAPYLKLVHTGIPWVIAKWAMSLDGKIATSTGDSRWISNATSRAWVHALRGRVDAVLVGSGTARADDPLLTARPPGPRCATRVVLDSRACLPLNSQLVRTLDQAPLLLACGPVTSLNATQQSHVAQLSELGVEILECEGDSLTERWTFLLHALGARRFTNLMVEGGNTVLGVAHDTDSLDEVHVFVAPTLFGGTNAPSPIGGQGAERVTDRLAFEPLSSEELDGDLHLWTRRVAR